MEVAGLNFRRACNKSMVGQEGRDSRNERRGNENPYEGFDIDPRVLTVDIDPRYIDPVDSHVLPDLLDESTIPKDLVEVDDLMEIGISYMMIDMFEQAIDSFSRIIWFSDDKEVIQEAWVNKGVSHSELEEWDEAIGSFREAIVSDEKGKHRATAENNLAFALWEFGKDEEALEHVEKAIEVDERFAEAWYNRGFFLNERGLFDQALPCLDNAIGLGYRSINVLEEKLRSCDGVGDYEEGGRISEAIESMREK